MTEEILKRVEECVKVNTAFWEMDHIRSKMITELQNDLDNIFKYRYIDYSENAKRNEDKSKVHLEFTRRTYTDDIWSLITVEKLESENLDHITCNRTKGHLSFNRDEKRKMTIYTGDYQYDISYNDLAKLCNHSDRDKLLELILSGYDNANIALQILNPE